ncbi:hypothetical protein [Streptosporangium sp. NPDC003464]
MTGWWQRARVVSALGTGALVLGGGPAVYAVGADDPATFPAEAAEADELNSWSQWVRADDVIRFRVWLEGSGTDARLAVETTPAEALRSIECPQEGAQVPPGGGAQMCSLGVVDTRRSVDVLLTMPDRDEDIELTAVARMRNRDGAWITHTARTTIENPASRIAEIMKAAQTVGADPVLPRPAPNVPPLPPGSPAGASGSAEAAGQAGPAGAATAADRPSTPPASPVTSHGPADPGQAPQIPQSLPEPVAPLNPPALAAPQVLGEPGARAVPPDPRPKGGEGMRMTLEEAPAPRGSAAVSGGSRTEQAGPEVSGTPSAAPDRGGASAGPLRPERVAARRAGRREEAAAARAETVSRRSAELAEAGQMPPLTGEVPQLPGPMPQAPGPMPQAPGQPLQVWDDPNLRMPLAAPAASPPSAATTDPQPLGAPLPRDVDGPGREIGPVAESGPLLTGMRGLPAVGTAIGGLLGLLWLQMKVQRRRESRPVL